MSWMIVRALAYICEKMRLVKSFGPFSYSCFIFHCIYFFDIQSYHRSFLTYYLHKWNLFTWKQASSLKALKELYKSAGSQLPTNEARNRITRLAGPILKSGFICFNCEQSGVRSFIILEAASTQLKLMPDFSVIPRYFHLDSQGILSLLSFTECKGACLHLK